MSLCQSTAHFLFQSIECKQVKELIVEYQIHPIYFELQKKLPQSFSINASTATDNDRHCCYVCQDMKMKRMADLQLGGVNDPRSRVAIERQIAQWDEHLETLNFEQYQLRCYVAALNGTELPNPKVHRPTITACYIIGFTDVHN